MVNVGGVHYARIEGMPPCALGTCRKRAHRRGGVVVSAHCIEHTRDEMHRLIADGRAWHEAAALVWEARPRVRLTFVE